MPRPQTNTEISIYSREEDWRGTRTETLVGAYDVWNEERNLTYIEGTQAVAGAVDVKEVEKGIVFLFNDIDLTDKFVRIGSDDYEIVAWDRFVDRLGDFHHIEFSYK